MVASISYFLISFCLLSCGPWGLNPAHHFSEKLPLPVELALGSLQPVFPSHLCNLPRAVQILSVRTGSRRLVDPTAEAP